MNYNIIHNHNVKITPWPIPDQSIDCIVTSPPYWALRNYGHKDQIGMEKTPEEYVKLMVDVFAEAWRVLKNEGTLWLNLGDTYYGGKGTNGASVEYSGAGSTLNKKALLTTKPNESRPQDMPVPGLKPKDLVGIPWMVAFALRSAGWYLRQDIIWHKPNPMPESVTDRCTKAHEYVFLLTKSRKYYYDHGAIMQDVKLSSIERLSQNVSEQAGSDRVPGKLNGTMKAAASWNGSSFDSGKTGLMKDTRGMRKSGNLERKPSTERGVPEGTGKNQCASVPWEGAKANKRSVWTVPTKPFSEAHFATFPEELIIDCIKAGCPPEGVVLDPFMGAGTTALAALGQGRKYIGLELNSEYIRMAENRIKKHFGLFA